MEEKHIATNGTIDEKIDRLAVAVKDGFDGVDKRLDGVDKRLDGVDKRLDSLDARLRRVETTMVTKSYLDDKLADLKGDLIVKLRKVNGKVDFLVEVLHTHSLISDEDITLMREEYEVFPSVSMRNAE
ncbi:MAG: hypothetical protein ABIG71_04515 [Candidatus Uhrbacteria bacterium]